MQIKLLSFDGSVKQNSKSFISWEDFILLISIVLFVFLILFIFRFLFAKNEIGEKTVSFGRQEPKMKTGDLVFVSYNNLLGYFMRGWTNSKWTHVGMILRDKEDIYVMETADYSDSRKTKLSKKKGILVVPFQTWKELHKHHLMGYMELETPNGWNRNLLASEFLKIQNRKLDTFGVGPSVWKKVLWKSTYQPNTNEEQNITCFELVVRLLQESGAAKKIHTPGSYYVNNLLNRELELTEGFRFGTPVQLIGK